MLYDLAYLLEKYINDVGNANNFANEIVKIFLKYNDISSMLNDIKVISSEASIHNIATYNYITKVISLNAKSCLLSYKKNSNQDFNTTKFYVTIMKCVIHELIHAKQNYILKSPANTLEYQMLKSSLFVLDDTYLKHPKRDELRFFYEMYHDFFPFERDAIISSQKIVLECIPLIDNKYILLSLKEDICRCLKGYDNQKSPIERLITGVNQNSKYETMFKYTTLPFYAKKEFQRNILCLSYSTEERYRWGLYLTPLEKYAKKRKNNL